MAHFLDSGNTELARAVSNPRIDEKGFLMETYTDPDFPNIGYSDQFVWFKGGDMTILRLLFYNHNVIGQEVMISPWNILSPLSLWLEVEVDENLDLGQDFYGKTVGIGVYDENCVRFSNSYELANHPIIKSKAP